MTSDTEGTIHYNLYIPDSYDGTVPYALYMALPGWGGLYFQGIGSDLREPFPYAGPAYNPEMIVVSPQLNDWGMTSARQAVALTEYLISTYTIDPNRVYISGYSGGGETLSLVLGLRPDLYAGALHVSSQWDEDLTVLAKQETPLYIVIGEDDDYYGSDSVKEAFSDLTALYRQKGLTEEEISRLAILDVRDAAWFAERNARSQHGGGGLFAREPEIMNWLFSQYKDGPVQSTGLSE
ncbi:MAG: prolyl oligopeptidase family serine peptidase [Clostridia bacterium]|nr:prolyl oligopeptidase family serine peptidase [Clostridia bacterium]